MQWKTWQGADKQSKEVRAGCLIASPLGVVRKWLQSAERVRNFCPLVPTSSCKGGLTVAIRESWPKFRLLGKKKKIENSNYLPWLMSLRQSSARTSCLPVTCPAEREEEDKEKEKQEEGRGKWKETRKRGRSSRELRGRGGRKSGEQEEGKEEEEDD